MGTATKKSLIVCRLLFTFCFLFFTPGAKSQSAADVGGIVTVHYLDGGDGKSPLLHNDGLPGFEFVGDLFVNVRVSEEISAFIELETVRGWNVQVYSGALTYKVSGDRLKVEAGKFVAPFGNFLPRRFAPQNFLYGFPLHYEYRTGLTTNDVPENNQELLEARGAGRGDYTNSTATAGAAVLQNEPAHSNSLRAFAAAQAALPTQPATGHIVAGSDGVKVLAKETYISGVQFFGKFSRLGYSVGLANGALSNPADLSVSRRPMIFSRLHVQPAIGLTIGVSAASGSYLNHKLVRSRQPNLQPEKYAQHVAGVDVEYSRGYWVFFGEGVFSRWQSPFISQNLEALAFSAEVRYKILPRLFVAARYGRLTFSEIADALDVDADGKLAEPWEFPVWRLETGAGYHLSRHAILKAVWQINRTEELNPGHADPADNLAAIQMTVFY
jgi:hypothetical protein